MGLPALACFRCLCPDGRTIRRGSQQPPPNFGTEIFIPVTNAQERLHRSRRKIIKTRGSFPGDEAATKLLFLAIRNAGLHWKRSIEWTAAMGQFAVLFADRFAASAR
ncbi:transposase [Inquilinus limosus]|uniref:transposase n=1 Tax=Inquilinus limosus TaxID=171674 RepID=UPI003F5CBF5A